MRKLAELSILPLALSLAVAGCRDAVQPSPLRPQHLVSSGSLTQTVHVVAHDLGTLGGNGSSAVAVNGLGQVVGYSSTSNGEGHVFLWTSQDGMTDLGTLGAPSLPLINAISDEGIIVGELNPGAASSHAFRWSPTTGLQDLGADVENTSSIAHDINSHRVVVGGANNRALMWSPAGTPTVIGQLLAGYDAEARSINTAGHVSGFALGLTAYGIIDARAFFWTPESGFQDLGTLDNGQFSRSTANDINDHDQVVGESDHRGFIWSPQDGMIDFRALTGTDLVPLAINNEGKVVGSGVHRQTADGLELIGAFLWSSEAGLVFLDPVNATQICGDWHPVAEAADINDLGMIVGWSTTDCASSHAIVWTLEAVDENRPPVALLGGPFAGVEGSPLAFDGSGSSDPDGDAVSYSWDFGDGSTSTEVSPAHTYVDNGAFEVTLTVTDPQGLWSSLTTAAAVENVVPSVDPFAGATILPGEEFTSGGGFSDPGSDIWTASVDYGDGFGTQTLPLAGKSYALAHVYQSPGSYSVRVVVNDDDGGSGSGQAAVTVQTPQDAVKSLAASVDGLIASGTLLPGNGRPLGKTLQAATLQLNAGNTTAAIGQLGAFINQIQSLELPGILSFEQGQALISMASRVIRSVKLA